MVFRVVLLFLIVVEEYVYWLWVVLVVGLLDSVVVVFRVLFFVC